MKSPLFLLLLLPAIANAQDADVSAQMRAGWSIKHNRPIVAPAINLKGHGLALSPEMMIYDGDDAPVCFGLKMSYEREVWKGSIEGGYGRYFDLYSTDGGSHLQSLNGWSNVWFLTIHYDRFFIEYDYQDGNVFSFGMRESIF